ncbi:MAG TPA: RNA 3'-terminal phosphate cyclase [Blastocatellia bacterium]|nr:RNA 3'-terminal phosphate cyclase [Blastocatellia bacterium]
MILIDGSFGEGGGQILRTALGLSLFTGRPFRIEKIRAGRKNPGLLRQHLTAVKAAARIGQAEVAGVNIGSTQLTFTPNHIAHGDYHFAVGTAGSATLVLQTILPALIISDNEDQQTRLTLEGGTHNPFAPPFDFLAKTFLPLLRRMGARIEARLERYGFYPAGGGRFEIVITPVKRLEPIELNERGKILNRRATALVAHLPRNIAERELGVIHKKLSWRWEWLEVESITNSPGPGNVITLEIESENVTEVFTGFGERGVAAEAVADQAVVAARRYLASDVAVGEYLADQLLLPMALARGGSFTTVPTSRHTTTNIEIIRKFLDVEISAEQMTNRSWRIGLQNKP